MVMYDYKQKLYELGIKLDKTGKQTCPQCSQKRKNKDDKCLTVSYERDAILYYCHHCGWTGSVFYEESKFHKQYNRPANFKCKENKSPLIKYFAKRGISESTLEKYNVSLGENNSIIFPYYKNGILVNVKTRTNLGDGKKTFTQTKDAEKTFFGVDFVNEEENLIIVEGEVDVLSLAEQGINAVSVPQGGSDKKLECLTNCSDEFLQKFKSFIIATDNDEVGYNLRENLISRFPKDKCKIVKWGKYKDANEALVAGEDLHAYINNAEYVGTDGIVSFESKWDEIYNELFGDDKNYYNTGWDSLDEIIKIKTGYLMVVSGYPSRGKSTFVDNLLVNLTKKYGFKHLIASFENTMGNYYRTIYEMYFQQPFWKLINEGKNIAFEKAMCTEDFFFLSEHFILFDNNRMWNIDDICKCTELEVIKHGIKTLVIDPYNRLQNDYKDREDKYIGSILAKLCTLAKRLNILIIFVAHPKKPDGETIPTMYSISGSGDWYNMSDYGIIVHRERDSFTQKLNNNPIIHVQKVKNFSIGDPSGGKVELFYNANKRILEDSKWSAK